ncbi:heterokaryon incompatibility protein (HET) domain-containing protein [Sarocladium implicatum]|nr:heterokaryon incompatibility protein (HET) domain-containing protein [Sarocladium implicatum]
MTDGTSTLVDEPARLTPCQPSTGQDDGYSYQPILNQDKIRILTLYPNIDLDAPLTGVLTTESLDAVEPYDTISYVWGAPTRTHSIYLDSPSGSSPLPLTTSIYGALRRLRLADFPRRLWADQVCINQVDVAERSSQVRLMNRVYRGAAQVLVWLGEDDDGVAEEAARTVERLSEIFKDDKRMEVFRREHLNDLAQRTAAEWEPLAKLTKLAWFNRIWVVQEIGTDASAKLYWGSSAVLSWPTLYSVSSVLGQEFHHLRARFSIYTPSITYLYRRFVRSETDEELMSAASEVPPPPLYKRDCFIYELHRARRLSTKDPRDHVYAFLGHFSLQLTGGLLAGIVPDYSLPVEDVYIDVAIRALRGPNALRVLSACQITYLKSLVDPSPQSVLPSWVPDWRVLPLHMLGSPATPHRAGGDTSPLLEIDAAARELRISGRRLDTVVRRSWSFFSHPFLVRQTLPSTDRRRPSRTHPIEALWKHICGFDTAPMALEPRYRDGGDDGHENAALFALVQTLANACIGFDRERSISTIESLSHAAAYLTCQASELSHPLPRSVTDLASNGDAFRWSREATLVSRHRRFGVTSAHAYYVLGPEAMQDGDQIAVFRGGSTPFVLRQLDDGKWRLLGECYTHGVMDGEHFDRQDGDDEWFTIV